MKAGDFSRADEFLVACPDPLPVEAIRPAVAVHLDRNRWAEALKLLNRIADRQVTDELHRTLARNMVCLQAHRPQVYRAVVEAHCVGEYRIAVGKNNRPILVQCRPNEPPLSLSADRDPIAALRKILTQLHTYWEKAQPIILHGLGDGYLVDALARHPVEALLNQQQAIYLVEPDPQLVRAVLMMHDYTGPDGPIEQERCFWFVGPDWEEQFAKTFFDDLYLSWPGAKVSLSVQAAAIAGRVAARSEKFAEVCRQWRQTARDYYAQLSREELMAVMGDNPPRPPRVLVLTTRFSTVLQHSCRDVARAFDQIGWEARLLIEPTDYHRQSPAALQYQVTHFRPDLVFQIDHLRPEHKDMFPENLPFACWIQDHLPNLMSEQAGASIGLRDFVLLAARPMYTRRYGYPQRQCIDLPKLTRVPSRPAQWANDGDDLVYVSNASGEPQALADGLIDQSRHAAEAARFVRAVCEELIATYKRGECVSTRFALEQLLTSVEKQTSVCVRPDEIREQLLRSIFNDLNNTLYRQQALRWAGQIAERRGLRLSLYGNGWADHPEFAEHARGVAAYGSELEELTRRAKINLQIVPYHFMHQRLLDGLVAGGFYLIRRHPLDQATQALGQFATEHLDDSIQSTDEALEHLAGDRREELVQLLERYAFMRSYGDPVATVQSWSRAGTLVDGRPFLPMYEQVAFDDAASLEQRILHYLEHPQDRRHVAEAQRQCVERRLTYETGMRRVVSGIAERLAEEPAA